MIEGKLTRLSDHLPDRPELGILLSGCVTDAERKAVGEAFYTFAQGDPGSFSVQFAVLLQAHVHAIKCAPEQLRKTLATELAQMSDVIVSNRMALNTAASAIAKDAAVIHDQVVSLAEFQCELEELISKTHESEAEARVKFLTQINRDTNTIREAAESILFVTGGWILAAILTVYLLGVASYPVLAQLVTWLEKIL
jgi:hypothetical protein